MTLGKLDNTIPYLVEVYKNNSPFKLEQFFKEKKDEGAIYIEYTLQEKLLIHEVIEKIYEHYQMESPSNLENGFKVIYGLVKAGVAVGSLANVIGPLVGFGLTGAEILTKKFRSKTQNTDAVAYLGMIAKNEENFTTPESVILKSIEMLVNLLKSNQIIIHVKNPVDLHPIDLQFIRTYFGFFKDLATESFTNYYYGINQANESKKLLVVFDWKENIETVDDYCSPEIKHLRWFVRRYQLCHDYKTNFFPLVVTEDIFVEQKNEMKFLENYLHHLINGMGSYLRVKGGSGAGKTTLATRFIQYTITEYSSFNITFIKSDFSGEASFYGGSLPEIKNALNKLELKYNEAIFNKIAQLLKKKEFKQLDQLLSNTFDLQSLLTPFQNNSHVIAILSQIGKMASSKDILDYFVSYYNYLIGTYNKNRRMELSPQKKFSEYNHTKTETIIDDLLSSLIDLLKVAKEKEEYVVWVVDDIQWADRHSALFFKKLITSTEFSQLPLLVLFLDREDNLKSIQSIQEFKNFRKTLIHHTLELRGFNKEDKNVEPFFVVECINLLGMALDGKLLHKRLFRKKWSWLTEDLSIILSGLKGFLTNLEENFSTSTEAIIQEKIHHIEELKGKLIARMIESGSFLGEPFEGKSSYEYVKQLYSLEEHYRGEDLAEVEKSYNVVANLDEDYETYYFSHAIYKHYLKKKHVKKIGELNLHQLAFEVLQQRLKNSPYELKNYHQIKLQCALHGSQANLEETEYVAAEYLTDLAKDQLFLNNKLKAEEYSEIAWKLYAKHTDNNDIRVISLFHTLASAKEHIGEAYRFLNDSIVDVTEEKSKNSFEFANLLLLRADIEMNIGRDAPSKIIENTAEDLKNAYQIGSTLSDPVESKIILATYHFEQGTILGSVGTADNSINTLKKGNDHYIKAIEYFTYLKEANIQFNKRLLFNSYIGVGNFHYFKPSLNGSLQKKRNAREAKKYYELALALTDNLREENISPGIQSEMVLGQNLAAIYTEEGDFTAAQDTLEYITTLYEQGGKKQNYLAMIAYFQKYKLNSDDKNLFYAVLAFTRIQDLSPYIFEYKEWMVKILRIAWIKLPNTSGESLLNSLSELNINLYNIYTKAKQALQDHEATQDGYY